MRYGKTTLRFIYQSLLTVALILICCILVYLPLPEAIWFSEQTLLSVNKSCFSPFWLAFYCLLFGIIEEDESDVALKKHCFNLYFNLAFLGINSGLINIWMARYRFWCLLVFPVLLVFILLALLVAVFTRYLYYIYIFSVPFIDLQFSVFFFNFLAVWVLFFQFWVSALLFYWCRLYIVDLYRCD